MRRTAVAIALSGGCTAQFSVSDGGVVTATSTGTSSSGAPDSTSDANPDTTADESSGGVDSTTSAADSTTNDDNADATTGGGSTLATDETTAGGCVPPGGALTFAIDVYPIISANCECHTAGAASGLSMSDAPTAYDSLVDVLAVIPQIPFVDPGDHENSYLFHKLNGTWKEVGGAGDLMPLSGMSLQPADIQTIADWIDGCALP